MKTTKKNLVKLTLTKLNIAKVGDINSIYGGSIPKETDHCYTTEVCTYNCNGDTIDTQ